MFREWDKAGRRGKDRVKKAIIASVVIALLVLTSSVTICCLMQRDGAWMEAMIGIEDETDTGESVAAATIEKSEQNNPADLQDQWDRQWDEKVKMLVAVPVENMSLRKTPGFGKDTVAELVAGTLMVWSGETVNTGGVEFYKVTLTDMKTEGYVAARYCVKVEYAADYEELPIVNIDTARYTYDMMAEDIEKLCKTYPDRLSSEVIGTSVDGRDIFGMVLGDPLAQKKIMIQAGIHGREYMTTQLVMKMLEYYAHYYDRAGYGDASYQQLFSQTAFYVVPMANPDGVTISQLGASAIRDEKLRDQIYRCYQRDRKDRYNDAWGLSYEQYQIIWKANANGVDLNNNFDAGWNQMGLKKQPSFENFKGGSAASEPETQALVDFATEQPYDYFLSYHSKGQIIYFDAKGNEPKTAEASEELAWLLESKTRYRPVNTKRGGYVNLGGFGDWIQLALNKPSVTIETGRGVCPLGIEEFPAMWYRNRESWAFLADQISD